MRSDPDRPGSTGSCVQEPDPDWTAAAALVMKLHTLAGGNTDGNAGKFYRRNKNTPENYSVLTVKQKHSLEKQTLLRTVKQFAGLK